MFDRKILFDTLRKSLFKHGLKQSQVDGIEAIVSYWGKTYPDADLRNLAYILATAYHETAHTFQPICERGSRTYFLKYEPGTKIGRRLGNTLRGDGYRFRGRGFVQLTGRRNYAYAGRHIGVDLVKEPDAALELDNATKILVKGMMEGWFTGKSLSKYIKPNRASYVNARRVVNGQDRARLIAGYARKFAQALRTAYKPDEPKEEKPANSDQRVKPKVAVGVGLVGGLLTALAAWWKEIAEWIGRIF